MEKPPLDRRVDKALVAHAAREILTFLRSNKVREAADRIQLRQKVAQGERGLEVCFRPSNGITYAHTISYRNPSSDIPLEVKINPTLNYTAVILKGQFPAPEGYEAWGDDDFGNTRYFRRMQGTTPG